MIAHFFLRFYAVLLVASGKLAENVKSDGLHIITTKIMFIIKK